MKISDLLHLSAIDLKAKAKDKNDAIELAVKTICKTGAIVDVNKYKNGVFKREEESTTGVGDGIAIPHCKSDAVKNPALAALVFKDGVDYEALDGEKVNLLFLIAAPNTSDNVHLDVLAKLSNILMHNEYVSALKKASSPKAFLKILDSAEAKLDAAKAEDIVKTDKYPKLLAATSCPTGIAHTYMAQEALEKAAKIKGVTIKVETNGAGGIKNALTDEEIEHADGIIVAADAFVEMNRFIGKRIVEVPVSNAIKNSGSLIDMALDSTTPIYKPNEKKAKQSKKTEGGKFHIFYKHLMSGISHMVPFVVAGGILLAVAFIIDMCCGYKPGQQGVSFGSQSIGAKIFNVIGVDFALGMMLPIMSTFIAYSIAGRAGIVSGFAGGMAAKTGSFSVLYVIEVAQHGVESDLAIKLSKTSAGFLGAILAGFLAGYIVKLIQYLTRNMSKNFVGVKSILIEPIFSTLIVGMAMFVINVPVAYINIGLNSGLEKLAKGNLIYILAIIVSAMMATDMGGPINKASHYFTIALIDAHVTHGGPSDPLYNFSLIIMAAHIVALMTPPIGCALSCWLFPQKYKKEDRSTALANLLTGFCGITEGAIPYAAADPGRVIPSCMIGSAVGGVVATACGVQAISSEGGTFSLITFPKTFGFALIAIVLGSFVTAIFIGLFKKDVDKESAGLKKWKGIPTQPVYNFTSKCGKTISSTSVRVGHRIKNFSVNTYKKVGKIFKKDENSKGKKEGK